ncbi:N-formylglutamate amidohydrolase [Roseisalinus antarcticus]|uniref:N-formylglutamate amidohydrolase n=1 Tax=Roseisalinus antarcticus TaxID=254357 RepID=A0A1Y5RT05_9RHOB|nr:N-formylglutamate amidohydrolase [Roseisalinus antarcticus]SLN22086.1 N-formylglutamate amidohydrolase [Roseisalinus antarcticus]
MPHTAYEIINQDADSPWLLTCDHASNRVPPSVAGGDIGLPPSEMQRHIAYDIGAAGVTRHLADLLGAPAVLSNFSRLVIDPNRGDTDPTLVMKLYDGTIIPANRHVDAEEVARRKAALYAPYHDAIARLAARREQTIYVAVHSFTPRLNGRAPRPWHIGILHAWDQRFSRPFIDRLMAQRDIVTGENQPYPGHLPGDAVDRHALRHGRPNALIELRHDLIDTPAGQRAWAERLAPLLLAARADMDPA